MEHQLKGILRTLEYKKEKSRYNNTQPQTVALAIEQEAYTSNISLKYKRLVKSYSSYYYTLISRNETEEYLYSRIPPTVYKELSKAQASPSKEKLQQEILSEKIRNMLG
jgi:hypothetical protein